MCMQRPLSFSTLRKILSERFLNVPDHRDTEEINYPLHDVLTLLSWIKKKILIFSGLQPQAP